MLSGLTKAGTPRKRPARKGEGRPTMPDNESRKKRAVYLSDEELRARGWDGASPAGGFLQRLVLASPVLG